MRQLVLGLMVAAFLAACGGSDSEEDGSRRPAPSSARAQGAGAGYVRPVDALCKDARPELAEIRTAVIGARDAARAGRAGLPETFKAFVTLLGRASVITERFQARLRAIEAPRGQAAFHGSLIDSVEAGRSNLREQESAARAQDALRLRELSVKGSVIEAERRGLVTGHGGFRFCGRG